MRYILSERQYKIIIEQWWNDPKHPEWKKYAPTDYEKRELKKSETILNNLDPHTIATIAQIGTALIPLVGPYISAGIGLGDASLYYKEGDKTSAGLTAAFSMIPLLGGVVTKIPGVKELGAKGMTALGNKLSKVSVQGVKNLFTLENLSSLELKVLNAINKNKDLVVRELNLALSRLPEVQKYINAYKKPFISKYGQEAYDESLRRLFNGLYTKQQFIDRLKSATSSLGQYARLGALKGIKFSQNEIKALDDMVAKLKNSKNLTTSVNLGGREIQVYFDDFAGTFRGQANEGTGQIWMNMKNMHSPEEIKSVLYHEAAHIKDASMKSPKLSAKYSKIMQEKQKVEDFIDANTSVTDELWKKYSQLFEKYRTHPWEITANNQMLINNVSSQVQKLATQKTPQKIISKLDKLLNSLKQNQKIAWDEYLDILGMDGLSHLTYLKLTKPQEYNNLMKKLYQQITLTKKELGLLK